MRVRIVSLAFWVLSGICSPGNAAITPEQLAQLPPPANHKIDFVKEIEPIFEASCIKCHGRGKDKGGLRLDTRETLLKGGDSGAAVVSGKSHESLLISLVMGFDPDNVMPKKGSRLKPEQVGLLRAWIDQDLPWDSNVTFGRLEPQNLKPRKPRIPDGPKGENPVDRFLQPYFAAHKLTPRHPVSDAVFARRAYLDVIGLLPEPEALEAFTADKSRDKRQRLVARLLHDDENYAEHWLTFWNDLLRNDYRGTGYIDGGRKQITSWLYSSLRTNMPFNQFVAKLVDPDPECEGFTKGIVWRGVVNASQTPQMQAAQHISQIFMGVNLKCASCHDSFVNDLTLTDAYGLAGVYADGPLEMVRCDNPTGKRAEPKFIYPELGAIDPNADKPVRLKRLAEIITQRQDARLTRTLVNRLWQKFMGRGLVDSLDDMEKPSWCPDLLDWLAEDFADHGYDTKHLINQILNSRAYQLPSVSADEQNQSGIVFHGPTVRRLTAEQFVDALSALTGVGGALPAAGNDFLSTYIAAQAKRPSEVEITHVAKWIWNDGNAGKTTKPGTVYFRREFVLQHKPAEATAIITCDDSFTLFVNGERAASGDQVKTPRLVDLVPLLRTGTNLFAISAENKSADKKTKNGKSDDPPKPEIDTPAGLFMIATIKVPVLADWLHVELLADFSSNGSWLTCTKKEDGWEKALSMSGNWTPAVELGGLDLAPWKIAGPVTFYEVAASRYGTYRASLMNANPLTVALGRPNREQVVTSRPMAATTLQALELTNGPELVDIFNRGAERLLDESNRLPKRQWVSRQFLTAIGRKPTDSEMQLAITIVGNPVTAAGIEDFLWCVAMLPEFQLIY